MINLFAQKVIATEQDLTISAKLINTPLSDAVEEINQQIKYRIIVV